MDSVVPSVIVFVVSVKVVDVPWFGVLDCELVLSSVVVVVGFVVC